MDPKLLQFNADTTEMDGPRVQLSIKQLLRQVHSSVSEYLCRMQIVPGDPSKSPSKSGKGLCLKPRADPRSGGAQCRAPPMAPLLAR